jgi:hypothetical protein
MSPSASRRRGALWSGVVFVYPPCPTPAGVLDPNPLPTFLSIDDAAKLIAPPGIS